MFNLKLLKPHAAILLFLVWAAFWLISFWPGYFDADTAYLFEGLQLGNLSIWHSYSYSLIFKYIWNTFHSLGPLLILQFGFFVIASIWILRKFELSNPNLAIGFLFLSMALPMHPFQLLSFLRDSFFSALFPILLILLFSAFRNFEDRFQNLRLFGIALITTLLCTLRLDAVAFFPVVALIVWFKIPLIKKHRIFFVSGITAAIILSHFTMKSLQAPELFDDRRYQLTSFVHPLSAIAHHGDLTVEQASIIDKVISIDALKEKFHPYQIRPFHESGTKPFTEDDWTHLIDIVPGVFLKNWFVSLESRWIMLLANLGIDGATYTVLEGKVDPLNPVTKNYEKMGLSKPEPNRFARLYLNLAGMAYGDTLVRWVCFSVIPFLFLSYLLIARRKENPFAMWLLALSWSRLPLIFLLAPGSHMKYCYQIYLATIFCYYLGRLERRSNKEEKEVVA